MAVGSGGELRANVSNHQVYLTWDSSYYNTVLRSTTKGGYYAEIASGLEDTRYVDTPPETEKTYYYVIQKAEENDERTKEIAIYVP